MKWDADDAEKHSEVNFTASNTISVDTNGDNDGYEIKLNDLKKEKWSNHFEYLLSSLGYAVGFSNIWRFPYLCVKYGGGSFLIPYFLVMFICAIPIFHLEAMMGQYTGLTCVRVWNIAPIAKGVGLSMVTLSLMASWYYNTIMAWTLYYLGMSFTGWNNLPWASCNNSWNTDNCFTDLMAGSKFQQNDSLVQAKSSAEEFWIHNVLELSPRIEDINGINWKLFICLFLSWTLTFVCIIRGIKTSGKIVYITVILPYILLTILVIRGATLKGSFDGIMFYLLPKWKSLLNLEIWVVAAIQVFYSLGAGYGGLITMASYNKRSNNITKDSIIIPLTCGLSSVYGGLVIFSVIGHLAYITKVDIQSIISDSGPGIIYVAYPTALSLLPGGAIWSIIFFLCLIMLGLDSHFATLETGLASLCDEFPGTLQKWKKLFTFVFCAFSVVTSSLFVTRAGIYYFQIVDWFGVSFAAIINSSFGVLFFVYIHGIGNLMKIFSAVRPDAWRITKIIFGTTWLVFCPIMLLAIFTNNVINLKYPSFNKYYKYPTWSFSIGFVFIFINSLPIPVYAVFALIKHKCNIRKLFSPNNVFTFAVQLKEKTDMETPDDKVLKTSDTLLE